jgi:C-terminal processing protease CtpA/Prc
MKLFKFFLLVACSVLLFQSATVADTIHLKDGSKVKGIVVENYYQSIVLSTIHGEKRFDKSDIKDILYDRKEQNLVKLGDYYQQNRNLAKAYTYYKKAYELNPDYKEAKDKFIYARSTLLRNPEKQFRDGMAKKQAFFKESGKLYDPKVEKTAVTKEERFKKATGLVLVSDKGMPKIVKVTPFSAAEESGIRKGDIIISIWGKLAGYLALDTIMDMMMESPLPEIILSVKRVITISAPGKQGRGLDNIGLSLEMREGGLVVAALRRDSVGVRSGLMEGDIITHIDGAPVRYIPFNSAKNRISNSLLKGNVNLDIARDLSLWRKEV